MSPWARNALLGLIPAALGGAILAWQGARPTEQGGIEGLGLLLVFAGFVWAVYCWATRVD